MVSLGLIHDSGSVHPDSNRIRPGVFQSISRESAKRNPGDGRQKIVSDGKAIERNEQKSSPTGDLPREVGKEWEDLVLAHRPRLRSAVYRILRNRDEAEDVADEAIARLVRTRSGGEDILDVPAWLTRIGLNLAIERARQFVRRARKLADVEEMKRPSVTDPRVEVEKMEMREIMWRHILDLPVRKQQVLVLRDMESLSYREVSRLLGIQESTARAHAHSAREELRGKLLRGRMSKS